jgi:hypothetical protein
VKRFSSGFTGLTLGQAGLRSSAEFGAGFSTLQNPTAALVSSAFVSSRFRFKI